MAFNLLFGCAQIETTVRDIGAVSDFMIRVLGAGKIEQQLAKEINDLFPSGEHKMEHLACGEAVFQLNAPSPKAERFEGQPSIHLQYLDRQGPCVTNLNYFVDDAVHTHELLTAMGAATHISGPSTVAPVLADYGANTRLEKPGKFYFMGSRALIGLDLEFMEPNFKRFGQQTAQYPAFVHPRPDVGNTLLRLLRVRIVVADLAATYRNLVKLFLPACRSNAYAYRAGALATCFRVGLGGLEIEYCQPLGGGPLREHLDTFGPGVVSVVFGTLDPDEVLKRAAHYASIAVTEATDDLGIPGPAATDASRYLIGCREPVGFDVSLEKIDAGAFSGESLAL